MKNKSIITAALLLIISGIILGAFGAHGLRPHLTPKQLDGYNTAVDYQLYHGLALLVLGGLNFEWLKKVHLLLMGLGLTLFSGSIYGLTISALMETKLTFLGPITPIGGTLLILAWSLILINFIKFRKDG